MADFQGTASGKNAGGTAQALANPGLNGKVKALQCKYAMTATDVTTADVIVFGRIPVGSVIIGVWAKWGAIGAAGANLTVKDGRGGTALTAALSVDGAQATSTPDYTGNGVAIANGEIVGEVDTANLTADTGSFEAYLLYSSPQ